jgi:NAD(P)-dependent dehydrogenase (short-subunit alcohol dehydrogenase family)
MDERPMRYLNTLFSLKNKVAVLTGGGGILAAEMARGLLEVDARVILLDINDENLRTRVRSLKQISKNITAMRCDVLDKENLEKVNAEILDRYRRLDVLINAAGGNMQNATVGIDQNIFELEIEHLKKVTDLNLMGTILPTLIFGKSMAGQKTGSIINISSMAVPRAITRVVGYSAAKAAVENFTRWMAVELAQKFGSGIRVNAIAPGFLLTEQNRTLLTNPDGTLSERGKTIINLTPFKRFGDPAELTGAVLFLAGDASRFITGTIIPIDGGFSAFSGV